MIDDADRSWMRLAIDLARQKGTSPRDTPIAAVVVMEGRMLASAVNETEEQNDATAHAEMVAFRRGGAAHSDMDLRGATLYSTLQPCGMCTMASIWAKVGRIVYGAGREDVHSMYFEDRHLDTMDFIRDAWREDLILEGGCLAEECAGLYFGPDDDVPLKDQGNI
ncbi:MULTISPECIES: nucleoside deaminase [unclassified Novosphingobium]|uniref:nucleoside deaminase n=1 Tax=unclassified Novosphingobium TaxID=2644732 RepID=UPI00135B0E9C|nr:MULTISPECIES: nucleoside deaminase [unclassified Novosphingobium]